MALFPSLLPYRGWKKCSKITFSDALEWLFSPPFYLHHGWRKFSKITFSDALKRLFSPPSYLHLGCSRMALLEGFYPLVGCEREEKKSGRREFFITNHFQCWLISQGERTNRTRKLILCDGSSDTYYSTETPVCIHVRTFLTASEIDVSISCTPRGQICKSCTPHAWPKKWRGCADRKSEKPPTHPYFFRCRPVSTDFWRIFFHIFQGFWQFIRDNKRNRFKLWDYRW